MTIRTLGLSLALLLFVVIPAGGQAGQQNTETLNSAAYPNTSDGLQSLIADILRAAKAKDSPREEALIHGLLMPEDSTWFIDEYGPGFGASLAAAYRRAAPDLEQEIRAIYEANAQNGLMKPSILRHVDPEKENAPIDHFLNCMNQIVPLYETAFQGDRPIFQMSLKPGGSGRVVGGDLNGYFVYPDSAFRFIPSEIFMRLPSERPVRIRLGMNVMQSKLIKNAYPRYPGEALKKRIGGKVAVRIELDRTGNIQEVKAIEGDPVLSQALMDAVKQWQFLPTRLDGDPIEVELDVEMVFELH